LCLRGFTLNSKLRQINPVEHFAHCFLLINFVFTFFQSLMISAEKNFNFYKLAGACLGGAIFIFSTIRVNSEIFDLRFIGFTVFTLLVTSQMTLTLPRSKTVLSFSDAMIYLTFLLFGGEAAVFVATLETLANCIYLKYSGAKFTRYSIPYNVGATALTTFITFYTWTLSSELLDIGSFSSSTSALISTLGILALSQFFFSSSLASIGLSLRTNMSSWKTWKSECYSSSLTQFLGAGLAGVVYKLFTLGDFVTISISIAVFTVLYFTFRLSIKELTKSIEKIEQAERDKAEAERIRAEQAEQHIEVLNAQLTKEEQMTLALQQSKDAFEYAALHDSLTDLFNRSYLIERLKLLLEMGVQRTKQYYILFLDLSRFKNINDSLGHNTGDKVLKLVANRLLRTVHLEDTVARIGGDEFAIILNDLASVEEAEEYARRIYQKLSSPFSVQGNRIFTKPHIGIAPIEADYKTPEEVLRDADIAMHHAKDKEIGMAVFNAEIRDKFLKRINLESDLRFAIDRREFSMHYQPLISLEDGSIIGFEALLRWQHPTRGFIPPFEFIPIAEDSGLIIPITNWILKETTDQLAAWQKISPSCQNLIVSVNISGKHLAQDGLIEEVRKVLHAAKIKPSCLKLEITESVAMENAEHTIVILNKLKELGVQLSIDDFGTGYSSLSYLHRLPFDTLKIDRSFVNNVGNKGENSEILQTIVSLAKNLKMRSIAEGIETESQLQILRDLDCDLAQGYLFSKPLPKEEMEKQLYQKYFWFPETYIYEDAQTISSSKRSPSEKQLPVF
jgi:diguanylate cyclase (GGDEF)-like protein